MIGSAAESRIVQKEPRKEEHHNPTRPQPWPGKQDVDQHWNERKGRNEEHELKMRREHNRIEESRYWRKKCPSIEIAGEMRHCPSEPAFVQPKDTARRGVLLSERQMIPMGVIGDIAGGQQRHPHQEEADSPECSAESLYPGTARGPEPNLQAAGTSSFGQQLTPPDEHPEQGETKIGCAPEQPQQTNRDRCQCPTHYPERKRSDESFSERQLQPQ